MITTKKNQIQRMTSQRRIILDYLKSVKTHPSAEVIYNEVRKQLPQISLGTVYRNLEVLREMGEIKEITDNIRRFDGDMSDHYHFKSEKCGGVIDVKTNLIHTMKDKKIKGVGAINNCEVYFSGLCHKCFK